MTLNKVRSTVVFIAVLVRYIMYNHPACASFRCLTAPLAPQSKSLLRSTALGGRTRGSLLLRSSVLSGDLLLRLGIAV